MRVLQSNPALRFSQVVGIGGIGSGIVFALEGDPTLGRNESRLGKLLDARDYCKLHIVSHYIATITRQAQLTNSFSVVPIGVVGDDEVGHKLQNEMAQVGMDTGLVRIDNGHPTLFSVCFTYPDSSGGNITSSNSAAAGLRLDDVLRGGELLRVAGPRGVALCLPEVPLEIRREFLELATDCDSFRVASFASAEIAMARNLGLLARLDLLALNAEEAVAIADCTFDAENPDRLLDACAAALTQLQPDLQIVLSMGADGAYAFADGAWGFCPAPQVSVASTAGAGDALLAGVLCALATGAPLVAPGSRRRSFTQVPLRSALDFAVLLAGYSVTSVHTIHPKADLNELFRFASVMHVEFSDELRRCWMGCGEAATDAQDAG